MLSQIIAVGSRKLTSCYTGIKASLHWYVIVFTTWNVPFSGIMCRARGNTIPHREFKL